jgi:hypothetical protein
VVCWSGICGLGSIEIGSLGPIKYAFIGPQIRLSESQFGLLPHINKPPLYGIRLYTMALCRRRYVSKGILRAENSNAASAELAIPSSVGADPEEQEAFKKS